MSSLNSTSAIVRREHPVAFVSSAVRSAKIRDFNISIILGLESLGMEVFAPQRVLPFGSGLSAEQIFNGNKFGVSCCSIYVLNLFHEPGEGVFMEAGFAYADKKTFFVLAPQNYKPSDRMMEGVLAMIPQERKVHCIPDLIESVKDYLQKTNGNNQSYWNSSGSHQTFNFEFPEDLFTVHVSSNIDKQEKVVELGCGYGRVMKHLDQIGFSNIFGFDYASIAVSKAKIEGWNAEVIKNFPCPVCAHSCGLVTGINLLCNNPADCHQKEIIQEAHRLLRPGGMLYLGDFLVNTDDKSIERYLSQQRRGKVYPWGVFQVSSDGPLVRHHTAEWIHEITQDKFDLVNFSTEAVTTMNRNAAVGFHYFGKAK